MRHEFSTAGQLIAMLQEAQRLYGKGVRVQLWDRRGDRIKPKRME